MTNSPLFGDWIDVIGYLVRIPQRKNDIYLGGLEFDVPLGCLTGSWKCGGWARSGMSGCNGCLMVGTHLRSNSSYYDDSQCTR